MQEEVKKLFSQVPVDAPLSRSVSLGALRAITAPRRPSNKKLIGSLSDCQRADSPLLRTKRFKTEMSNVGKRAFSVGFSQAYCE
jgi:hypothetical protein